MQLPAPTPAHGPFIALIPKRTGPYPVVTGLLPENTPVASE